MKIRTIVGLLLIFTLVVGSTGFAAASDDGQKQVQEPQQAQHDGTMLRSQFCNLVYSGDCSGTLGPGDEARDRTRSAY